MFALFLAVVASAYAGYYGGYAGYGGYGVITPGAAVYKNYAYPGTKPFLFWHFCSIS